MADGICCIERCDRPRDRRHQSRMCVTHRCTNSQRTCSIERCGKPHNSHGWCKEHYDRYLRHGDPTVVIDRTSKGWLHDEGYRRLSIPGHPLASSNGHVFEHRVVLYDKVGPGPHPCHWCTTPVDWSKSWPHADDALVADHLDGNRLNNDPVNLVPACQLCNYTRGVATA